MKLKSPYAAAIDRAEQIRLANIARAKSCVDSPLSPAERIIYEDLAAIDRMVKGLAVEDDHVN